MKKQDDFNISLKDSQATFITPLAHKKFDIPVYEDYEQQLLEKCSSFWESKSGVLVYRRMRVAEVFSYGCRNMQESLEWQLGGLRLSMGYKADIANFLEPWYGIGTIASAYGREYVWHEGQAPVIGQKFASLDAALEYNYIPVIETNIGRQTIQMAEYFLEKTKGKIPVSYCDVQSPLNIAENVVNINTLMTDLLLNPDSVKDLFETISKLMIDFTQVLKKLIGNALVCPGHGFASSRCFEGLGMSNDLFLMLPDDIHQEIAIPYFEKASEPFGGPAFHSCGDWHRSISAIKQIKDLRMVDAAFSKSTDPDPNPPEVFSNNFAGTDIIVNARIVGGLNVIEEKIRKLWRPGMKLIVVTYCKSPKEQEKAYDLIHEICKD
jgi:hypothetical protein